MTCQVMNISGADFTVKEIKGQRVVSTKQIAELHNIKPKVLQNNYLRNKKHFEEGIDYFQLKEKGSETINLRVSRNYFTESGYLMLTKSLNDDLSWKVQRALVQGYFRVKAYDLIFPLLSDNLKKIIKYAEMGLNGVEISKLIGQNRQTVQVAIKKLKQSGWSPKKEVNHG